ncbi:Hypothetical_protein [Hexamita inflata]|uniref:Hypothetical_protein n=1 Tax=Hexamita inflata TaxID=28002 RepID=A0ABP1KS03_9EUKA
MSRNGQIQNETVKTQPLQLMSQFLFQLFVQGSLIPTNLNKSNCFNSVNCQINVFLIQIRNSTPMLKLPQISGAQPTVINQQKQHNKDPVHKIQLKVKQLLKQSENLQKRVKFLELTISKDEENISRISTNEQRILKQIRRIQNPEKYSKNK